MNIAAILLSFATRHHDFKIEMVYLDICWFFNFELWFLVSGINAFWANGIESMFALDKSPLLKLTCPVLSSDRGHQLHLPRVFVIDLLLILYVPVSLPKSATSREYLHQPATRKSGTISPKLKEKTSIYGRNNPWYVLICGRQRFRTFSLPHDL